MDCSINCLLFLNLNWRWGSCRNCAHYKRGRRVCNKCTHTFLGRDFKVCSRMFDGRSRWFIYKLFVCMLFFCRCTCAIAAYFLYKYAWGVDKTMSFLRSKRPDLEPNPGFIQQLFHLDQRLCGMRAQRRCGTTEYDARQHAEWNPGLSCVESTHLSLCLCSEIWARSGDTWDWLTFFSMLLIERQ